MRIGILDLYRFIRTADDKRENYVRKLLARGNYVPGRDYYFRLKPAIRHYHSRDCDKAQLEAGIEKAPEGRKQNFRQIAKRYDQFWRKICPRRVRVRGGHWQVGIVDVTGQPNLGLIGPWGLIGLQLYFQKPKRARLGVRDADLMHSLMRLVFGDSNDAGMKMAVFDIWRMKLLVERPESRVSEAFLRGELAEFEEVLNRLRDAAA